MQRKLRQYEERWNMQRKLRQYEEQAEWREEMRVQKTTGLGDRARMSCAMAVAAEGGSKAMHLWRSPMLLPKTL